MANFIKNISIKCLLIVNFISCSGINNEPELKIRVAPVESFVVLNDSIPNVSFLVKAWWSTSCGQYYSSDIINNGSVYYIKIYGFEPSEASVCEDAFTIFEARINIKIVITGHHTFKFWVNDSTSIDTTFVVSGI